MSKRQTTSRVVKKMGAIALAFYIPAFFKIHLRYIRNYPIVWAGLFVAPFIAVKMALTTIFGWFNPGDNHGLGYDILAIFIIALCFFAAERNRYFRGIYIYLAPIIIFSGLIYWAWKGQGFGTPGFIVLAILIWLFSAWIWRLATHKGFYALSHGGSRRYAKAAKFYQNGDYEQAASLIKKLARKGHFKSLFLLGEMYEKGRGQETDLFKAAQLYLRASKKGYHPASERFQAIYVKLSREEHERLETSLLDDWLDA